MSEKKDIHCDADDEMDHDQCQDTSVKKRRKEIVMESGNEKIMAEAVVHSLLEQLRIPEERADALAYIRDKHTLEWLSRVQMPTGNPDTPTEAILYPFVRTCAAEGFTDVLLHAAVVCPRCLDAPDRFGRTALFWAAYKGHLFTFNRLLDVGGNAKAIKSGNENLLHVLAKRKTALSTDEGWFAKAQAYLSTLARNAADQWNAPNASAGNSEKVERPPSPTSTTGGAATAAAAGPSMQAFLESPTAKWLPASLREKMKEISTNSNGSFSTMVSQGMEVIRSVLQPVPDEADINELSDWDADEDEASILERHKNAAADIAKDKIAAESSTPAASEPQPSKPSPAAPAEATATSESQGKKDKHVDWKKFMDEGALSSYVPEFDKLVAFTIRRLCRLLDVNAVNDRGETPLFLAHKFRNTLVEKYLKECGAQNAAEMSVSPSAKKQTGSRAEFLDRVRTILDMQVGRVSMPPKPYVRGKKYRILSMDGGGIRCICHPIVIRRILERFPDFLETVHMFCGCSGSSPAAAGFVMGLNTQQMQEIVTLTAVQTLSKKEGNQVTGFMYTSKWTRMLCDVIFGDTRMEDLSRPVVIPAFLIDNGRDGDERHADSLFLTNNGANGSDRIADVCMRSGSAPTYFRCYQGFVDGGVFANNPSSCGITVAAGVPPNGYGVDLKDIVCLSLGTGFSCKPYFEDESVMSSGGIVQWGMGILDLYDLSQRFSIDNTNKLLLGERYMRYMPPCASIKLDNLAQIDEVKAVAESMIIEPILDWIAKYWYD